MKTTYQRLPAAQDRLLTAIICVTSTHDGEGNLLTDGHYTYTWDARNRMTTGTLGTDTWNFQYDSFDHRVSESKNGVLIKQLVWKGTDLCEERFADGKKVINWNHGFEERVNGAARKLVCLRDHIESGKIVFDLTNANLSASYDYNPMGRRTKILGMDEWSCGYTGHFWHESGLSMAHFRTFNPDTGRWISRDPIEESGGFNLYRLSSNNTINLFDYLGLSETKRTCNICILGGHADTLIEPKGCDKVFMARCFSTPNGGSCWPSSADLMLALKLKDPRARPDDTTLGIELMRQIKAAENAAASMCDSKKPCCSSIDISVSLEESKSMKAAKARDPLVFSADRYSNNWSCSRKQWRNMLFNGN